MQLELEHIKIENFLSAGTIDLKLNQPGLILIEGVNRDAPRADSNGSGKSLLFDAICWCIWGKTVRGQSGDAVVRDSFPNGKRKKHKDCAVILTIRDGADTYVISRHRADTRIDKPNDLKLFVNGVEKGKKVKNLQEIIDRTIGFDFETFCAMMPGTGIRAANMTDSEIKKLLEKILQTENLTAAYTKARERAREVASQLASEQTQETKLRNELAALERDVQQLRELEHSFETAKAEQVLRHKAHIQGLLAEVEEIDSQLAQVAETKKTFDALAAEVAELSKRFDLEYIQVRAAQIRSYQDADRELKVFEALRKSELDVLSFQLGKLEEVGEVCTTCNQEVSPEHKEAEILELRNKQAEATVEYENWSTRISQLAVEQHSAVTKLDQFGKLLSEMLSQRTEAMTLLKPKLETEKVLKSAKVRLGQEFAREQKLLKEAEAQTHNFTQIFADKAAKAFALASELSKVLTAVKKLSAEKKLCDFWVEGFSPAGLRSFMLDYVTPILNDRAAYYSEVLTGGVMKVTFSTKKTLKSGEERDEFQIIVDQLYGSETYEGISVGEKARADLIISMALGDLATYRTAKQLPWRFLDEPFENIDKTGNEAVINLLNDQKTRYKTVFVITHKPSLQNMFTQRVTVTKENGISSVATNY